MHRGIIHFAPSNPIISVHGNREFVKRRYIGMFPDTRKVVPVPWHQLKYSSDQDGDCLANFAWLLQFGEHWCRPFGTTSWTLHSISDLLAASDSLARSTGLFQEKAASAGWFEYKWIQLLAKGQSHLMGLARVSQLSSATIPASSFLQDQLLSCAWLLQPPGQQPARLLCPWDSPGKNSGADYHCLLCQGIFPNQGSKSSLHHLLHGQADSSPTEVPGNFL